MSATTEERLAQREQQIQQAEELLASVPQQRGVAKGLFYGEFVADWVFPYPQLSAAAQAEVDQAVARVADFCDEHLDPDRIDRQANIPREVIDGLAEIGVLGMTAPKEMGGQGFTQMGYGHILQEIGGRCSSTAIFVNAHHSIGMRALILFGTEEQKARWLPDLVAGAKLSAFALTEPMAGSDAANVQTTATPSEDGSHYVLSGQKRYITNGGIADVLTVMARTPHPDKPEGAITAFLVTPDMEGFEVVEARAEKLGIRGTATGKLRFTDMKVPAANVLGPKGKGLKVALTVLDFGRTTFGSCCTGAARTCVRLAVRHAATRVQFGRPLGEFELVQKKLAQMAGWTYAMEAMTQVTAGLIDRGLEDFMLETAMLKVWSTERLWTIVNDSFQIHGGAAYFTDKPLERILRDARINQIGEGANEVLMSFIALTGLRGPALRFKDIADNLRKPTAVFGKIVDLVKDRGGKAFQTPEVPVRSLKAKPYALTLGKRIARFGRAVQATIVRHREEVVERQLAHERLAWAAMEIFACAAALSRWDAEIAAGDAGQSEIAEWFVTQSLDEIAGHLDGLRTNNDTKLLAGVDQVNAVYGG